MGVSDGRVCSYLSREDMIIISLLSFVVSDT